MKAGRAGAMQSTAERAYMLYVFICVIYALKSIAHKRVRCLILDLIMHLQITLTATLMWLFRLKVMVIQSYFDVYHGTENHVP